MEHLSDNQLLEMLHAPGAPEAAAVHLADCADCRRRMAELREGWDLLGQWSIEEPTIDLADVIMGQAVRRISLGRPGAWMRIAASIAVGLGLGGLAARPRPAPVSAQQVSEAIYLEALALDSSTGWTSPLLTATEDE